MVETSELGKILFSGSIKSNQRGITNQRKRRKRVGVFDIETDPFKWQRLPEAFCCEVYTDEISEAWWGDNCLIKMVEYFHANPGTYYAHNGGRFDFHYLVDFVDPHWIKVINGRIATMRIGDSVLIDSFLLAPFSLDEYMKQKVDYRLFESNRRERNKEMILAYLHSDCVYLYNLITGFHDTLGNHMTIGSAAFAKLKQLDIIPPRCDERHDDQFRPFYFGGRTQAFKGGYFPKVSLDYIDINSAYPDAMTSEHPWGPEYDFKMKLPRELGPCFVTFTGRSRGVLPSRNDDTQRIEYYDVTDTFDATGWEIAAGLETGELEIDKILGVWIPKQTQTFEAYVQEIYQLKKLAKISGDRVNELAYKYLLNACYGKFATNPKDFKDFQIIEYNDCLPEPWFFETDIGERDELSIWSRPSPNWWNGYFDVATAASITGKVRAKLWSTLCQGEPWYCDTDSIIGEGYNLPDSDELGDWKSEGHISQIAIAGRKLYTARVTLEKPNKNGALEVWKTASKGGILDYSDVIDIAQGNDVLYKQDAPTYSLGGPRFLERWFTSTI